MPLRPRRSVLYMPGSNARALKKAKSLDADALILDLEDAVAPDAKDLARDQVCEAVKAGGYGPREIAIRINSFETDWGAKDLAAAVAAGPDAVLIPKVNSADDIHAATRSIREIASANGQSAPALWVMMETPLAMLHAEPIAATAKDDENALLQAFILGTNDLAKETRTALLPGRAGMMTWLMTTLAAARAYGLDVIDGVYNAIGDVDGFVAECTQGQELGMDGKTLIHPSQIDPCNAAFGPSDEDVAWARKVIEAFKQPENSGKGVLRIDGKMVELLHAQMAERTVAIADAISDRAQG